MTNQPEKTIAQKIWDDIANTPISMFGLPAQLISQYCSPVFIEPTKLYLNYKIGALLPALENIFSKKYDIELMDKFITIRHKAVQYAI